MLHNASGRNLWIMDETGAATPVNSHKDIQDRKRGDGIPDWWVAAKEADWAPPARATAKTAPAGQAQKPSPRGAVTWDSPLKPKPSEQQLEPSMRDTLHTVGEGKDLNVSSAYRPDKGADLKKALGKKADPHSEGRAVDINYVNGAHISEVANKGGAADAELRRQAEEMQARAENDPNVQAFISPYGGFYKTDTVPPTFRWLGPQDADVKAHWNHIHIAVFKRK